MGFSVDTATADIQIHAGSGRAVDRWSLAILGGGQRRKDLELLEVEH
jgi:hypothetical protein